MKLSQFTLRDLLLVTAAVAAALGVQIQFWDYSVPQERQNFPIALGWYLLAASLATAMIFVVKSPWRFAFCAAALFGWSYFAFVLKLGQIQFAAESEWLEHKAWLGLCMMGLSLLIAFPLTSIAVAQQRDTRKTPE